MNTRRAAGCSISWRSTVASRFCKNGTIRAKSYRPAQLTHKTSSGRKHLRRKQTGHSSNTKTPGRQDTKHEKQIFPQKRSSIFGKS